MLWPVGSYILIQGPYSNTPTMFFTVGTTVLLMMTNHSLPKRTPSTETSPGRSTHRRLINAAPLATRDRVDGKSLFSCSLTLALERTLQGGCIFPSNAIKPTSDFPARWRQQEGGSGALAWVPSFSACTADLVLLNPDSGRPRNGDTGHRQTPVGITPHPHLSLVPDLPSLSPGSLFII